jgi:flagellar basal body-associated protein FliL
MAAAASALTPEVDSKMVWSVVVGIVLVIVAYMLYMYFFSKPDGAITADEYNKLAAADQALWKKSGNYYVKA